MPNSKCYFCTDLEAEIRMDKERRAIFGIALVTTIDGVQTMQAHSLKCCPECGKEIDFDGLYEGR